MIGLSSEEICRCVGKLIGGFGLLFREGLGMDGLYRCSGSACALLSIRGGTTSRKIYTYIGDVNTDDTASSIYSHQ